MTRKTLRYGVTRYRRMVISDGYKGCDEGMYSEADTQRNNKIRDKTDDN